MIRQLKKSGEPERNSPCPCNSGKKYKKCCFIRSEAEAEQQREIRRKVENAKKHESQTEDKEKEVKSAGGSGTSSETADRIRDNRALAVKILGDKVKEYKFPIKIGDGALSIKGERGFSVLGYQEFGFKDRLENVMRKLGVVWV